jgi:hypothetical protein
VIAGLGLLALVGARASAETTDRAEISAKARQVVEYLVADWNQQFHSTSVPLAMANLGMEPDDTLRLEIAAHFRSHTELANNLKWWGTNNYILSNDEKLIAKYLLNIYRDEERLPGAPELAKAVALSEAEVESKLAFLARAGLLEKSAGSELGFSLTDGYRSWGGPLRYNFHTVSIEGQQPFDVW